MANDNSKRILESSYADLLKEVVEHIVFYDEQPKAKELSAKLFKAVSDNMVELKQNRQLLSFYEEVMRKLKYIALPLLEDSEVVDLIRNNFCFQFKIENYDLIKKLSAKLLNIIVIEDRNKLKDNLKKAILENTEKIAANHEIKQINDWLKNYVANIGLDNADKLAKTQYLISLRNNKTISPVEYDELMKLFNFYDRINLASDEPEGFDEEAPVKIKGKLYIFRKGVLEEVPENPDIEKAMLLSGEISPNENKPSAALQADNLTQDFPTLAELQEVLNNYSSDSLEHKAISQEISRLKRAELKKTQKIDAKK